MQGPYPMKPIRTLTIVTASLLLFGIPAQAQTIDELTDNVQRSVCQNDWEKALIDLGRIIGSSDISADYRDALMLYRRQIQTWRATNTEIDATEVAECQPYLVEENDVPDPSFTEPHTLDWNRAISAIQSGTGTSSENTGNESGCDPSYPSMCIPIGAADLDCGDISQRRFTVLSPDPHGFDGDRDGIGCER